MRDPGRDHCHVAGPYRHLLARWAAERDPRLAGSDAPHLVRDAVEMVIAENPVAPAIRPVLRRERALHGGRVGRQCRAIDEQRQDGVREASVIGKAVGLRFDHASAGARPNSPKYPGPPGSSAAPSRSARTIIPLRPRLRSGHRRPHCPCASRRRRRAARHPRRPRRPNAAIELGRRRRRVRAPGNHQAQDGHTQNAPINHRMVLTNGRPAKAPSPPPLRA